MKRTLTLLLLAVLACAAYAFGKPAPTSPLLGRWAVDTSRLPMPPAARPMSVHIRFKDVGKGRWSTEVVIMDAGGTRSQATSTYALDGTPTRVQGSTEADIAAVRQPAPDVLVMALGKGGVPASTRIYAVRPDGTLVETAVYFGQDGKPIMRTHYFSRADG